MRASGTISGIAPPGAAFVLAGFKLLVHLLTNHAYGFHRDELYFIVCGSRLAWGYVDQGPLVPALAALSRAVGGESLAALRFLPAIAGALTVFATSWLASLLGGGRFAAVVAGVSVLVAPAYLRMHTMLHIPTFESMFWAIGCVLLALALKRRDPRPLLALGVLLGTGFLNKPTMVLFGAGTVVGLLLYREARIHLRSPFAWAGVALAVLIGAPFVLWQLQNDWPSAGFVTELETTLRQIPRWGFLLGQIVYLHPVTLPVWLGGLVFLLRSEDARPYRPLAWIWITPFLVFLFGGAKLYYLAAAYPPLLAAGGVWLERLLERKARGTVLAVMTLGGLLLAPAGLPIVPLERYPDFIRALTGGKTRAEELHEVINDYYDMTGWVELTQAVRQVEESLAAADSVSGSRGILASSYGEASALIVFGPDLPPVRSGHLSFHAWGAGPTRPELEILVGFEPAEAQGLCSEAELAARYRHPHPGAPEDDVPIIVCRPRRPLSEVWPALRHGF